MIKHLIVQKCERTSHRTDTACITYKEFKTFRMQQTFISPNVYKEATDWIYIDVTYRFISSSFCKVFFERRLAQIFSL